MTNVMLWDLALLVFHQKTSNNSSRTSISTQLWAHLALYSDPNGPLRTGRRHPHAAAEVKSMAWYWDGLGHRLTIWSTAQPYTEAYALRPYPLRQVLRGCKLFSSRGPQALRI